jgi:hypothetical protein
MYVGFILRAGQFSRITGNPTLMATGGVVRRLLSEAATRCYGLDRTQVEFRFEDGASGHNPQQGFP